ncbi:hypothetical protein BC936DRAFT_143166, partial [Jimgerdemannia flammicorona]
MCTDDIFEMLDSQLLVLVNASLDLLERFLVTSLALVVALRGIVTSSKPKDKEKAKEMSHAPATLPEDEAELFATDCTQASASSSTLGRFSTAAQLPPATDIEKWDTKKIVQHLQDKFPGELLQEDFDILVAQRIGGHSFLRLTKDDLMADGMKRGPATVIAGYVEELK